MARLSEVMNAKKGGKLLTRDLLTEAVMITEDITESTDIRETDDGKYLAIQVKIDGEVKDWNPTAPQLKSIVEVLGKPANLKGKVFQVTGFTKDGYKSKTTAVELKGDYAPEQQQRLLTDDEKLAAMQPTRPPSGPASDLAVFLGAIEAQPKGHVAGDVALDELALLVCGGDVTKANFMKGVAKSAGRIKNEGGCWSVVK